jgi:hypothetical protein
MKFAKLILGLACLMPCALVAQQAKVTQLMSKDLTGLPGGPHDYRCISAR